MLRGERLQQVAGLGLRLGDVRLVERIDVQRRAGDRRGEFPAEELGAEPVEPGRQAENRMAGRLQRGHRGLVGRVAFGGDDDEGAVLAVFVGPAERLVDDRQRALALLAGALGDQLFDPEAERRQRSGSTTVSLSRPASVVAAMNAPSSKPALA